MNEEKAKEVFKKHTPPLFIHYGPRELESKEMGYHITAVGYASSTSTFPPFDRGVFAPTLDEAMNKLIDLLEKR